jgi:hypothetical protein
MDGDPALRPIGTAVIEPLDDGAHALTLVVTAHLPLRALPGLIQVVGRVVGDRAEILTLRAIGPAHPSWPPVIATKVADPVLPPGDPDPAPPIPPAADPLSPPRVPAPAGAGPLPAPPVPRRGTRKET